MVTKSLKSKVLCIIGPTATGKTDLALSLAKKLDGELISVDSRQVYKGLDIGSGKLPGEEVVVERREGHWVMDGVSVHMLDVVGPEDRFSVREYVSQAGLVLESILNSGKLPILVGGTGLYLKGLLEGFDYLQIPSNQNLRDELGTLSVKELQEKLKALSPQTFLEMNNSDKNNPRRLIRRIEIVSTYPHTDKISNIKDQKYDVLKIGLTTDREVLNQRIDVRVEKRVEQGMISEAVELKKNGLSLQRMHELGLEYRYLADVLIGKLSKEEFKKLLKIKIHQYAKRQMTWFQEDKSIQWFDISDPDFVNQVAKRVEDWYNTTHGTQN